MNHENYKPKFWDSKIGATIIGVAGTLIGVGIALSSEDVMGYVVGGCVVLNSWIYASYRRTYDMSDKVREERKDD